MRNANASDFRFVSHEGAEASKFASKCRAELAFQRPFLDISPKLR
jgi:hypothetical protein